jgi:hypothetical protein
MPGDRGHAMEAREHGQRSSGCCVSGKHEKNLAHLACLVCLFHSLKNLVCLVSQLEILSRFILLNIYLGSYLSTIQKISRLRRLRMISTSISSKLRSVKYSCKHSPQCLSSLSTHPEPHCVAISLAPSSLASHGPHPWPHVVLLGLTCPWPHAGPWPHAVLLGLMWPSLASRISRTLVLGLTHPHAFVLGLRRRLHLSPPVPWQSSVTCFRVAVDPVLAYYLVCVE